MPISQNRMIRLIQIARAERARAEDLKVNIKQTYSAVSSGMDPFEALTTLQSLADASRSREDHIIAIAEETKHFAIMAKRNERNRLSQKRRRGEPETPRENDVDFDSFLAQIQTELSGAPTLREADLDGPLGFAFDEEIDPEKPLF